MEEIKGKGNLDCVVDNFLLFTPEAQQHRVGKGEARI